MAIFGPNLKIAALAGALAFTVGFGACEAYEHGAAWGLGHKLEKAKAVRDTALAAARTWEANRKGWVAYAQRLEGARGQENTLAAGQVSICSVTGDNNAHTAFNSGYAAGQVAGARSCGVSNGTSGPIQPVLRPSLDAGGLLDTGPDPLFGPDRAYRPSSAVPAHR